MKRILFSLLFLLSCTKGTSPWQIDSIATGDARFNTVKLIHKEDSPLNLELVRTQENIYAFLYLNQFKFHPSSQNPAAIKVKIELENQSFEELLPLLKGKMKVKISPKMTQKIISSLKDGQKVVILIDGFEKRIDEKSFPKIYDQWMGKSLFLQNSIKGPIE